MDRKPSKITQKDRYGNQVTFEFAPEIKPIDPTALAKHAMDQGMEVPEISMMEMGGDEGHPGGPQGSDTVPAWLTPGEFVVNAEAMRMPGVKEQVEAINNQGRAIQQMQGGSVPSSGYNQGGQIPFIAGPRLNEPQYQAGGGDIDKIVDGRFYSSHVPVIKNESQYQDDGGWITDQLLDKLAEVESGGNNDAVSPVGAIGKYQWLPKSAAKAGYGVKAFDPKDEKAARKATAQYLRNMQKHHGFTPEETLRAYNWGPGNVINYNKGKRKDIPDEALNYPRKILGVENTQGVRPPGDVPLPTARPGQEPQALPTPRPEEEGGLMSFLNKYVLGEKSKFNDGGEAGQLANPFPPGTYAYEQFEKNRPGQVQYTPPPVSAEISPNAGSTSKGGGYGIADGLFDLLTAGALGFDDGGNVPAIQSNWANRVYGKSLDEVAKNPNVVPELTDVPSGHKMFGGNENLGTPKTEPSFLDKYILGPKTKDQNFLTEDDKGFIDKQTAQNELLASPEIAEEENAIADIAEVDPGLKAAEENADAELIASADGDVALKDDVQKKILNKINDAALKDPNATGPGSDQKGANKSEEEIAQAAEQDPSLIEKAGGFLKEAFGELFDGKELAKAAILYAGSRALGYNHSGSMQYVAKNYLGNVQANADAKVKAAATHDKRVFELAKSDKFTPGSVAAYKKSRNPADLVSKKATAGAVPTGVTEQRLVGGKRVSVQQVKLADGSIGYNIPGKGNVTKAQLENATKKYDPSFDKNTSEYRTRRSRAVKSTTDIFKGIQDREDKYKIDQETKYKTGILPQQAAHDFWTFAEKYNVDPESDEALDLMGNAYRQAIQQAGIEDAPVAKDLKPFLEAQYIRQQTSAPQLFQVNTEETADDVKKSPKYVRSDKMNQLTNVIDSVGQGTGAKRNDIIDALVTDWGQADQKQWNRRANKGTETGFYLYAMERANQYLLDKKLGE